MKIRGACLSSIFAAIVLAGCQDPLTFDSKGYPHGTGEKSYCYKSGAARLIERYKDGQLVDSRWFKPDGTLIQETAWQNGTGEGLYLREDGSIRTRMRYVNGTAEGETIQYDEAGNETREMYHAGNCVDAPKLPTTRPGD